MTTTPTAASPEQVQVALSKTFMACMGQLEPGDKSKANQFVMKFMSQPTSPEFNFEQVGDAFDDNLRLMRVTRTLRAVVFRPEEGNAYVLLWLDAPASARDWARRRSCKVHPDTGALQVFVVQEEDEAVADQSEQLAEETAPEPAAAPEVAAPDVVSEAELEGKSEAELEAEPRAEPEVVAAPEAFTAEGAADEDVAEEDAASDVAPLDGEGSTAAAAAPLQPLPATEQFAGLFGAYSGAQLRRIGVPTELLYRVRHLETRDQFDSMVWLLPADAEDALMQLIEGEKYNKVLTEVHGQNLREGEEVDLEDYAAALQTDTSRAEFKVVEDEDELAKMMDQPLAMWRTYLHRSQLRLVEKHHNGPVRVLGGAGTGKTVVAMHRAAWMVKHLFTGDNDRVLFTTFTRNLAADIEENLRQLCTPQQMRRIEVVHLDGWVNNFLRRQGFKRQIKYFSNTRDSQLQELWEEAMQQRDPSLDFPRTFYREEWEQVIQAYGITTARAYYRVARKGRGVRLFRKQRHLLWLIFEEYQNLMADHGVCEREDAIRAARRILIEKGDILPYRSVLVDEAQDMSNEAFKLIRQMVPDGDDGRPNDIFIVGDGHQRIYNHRVVLSHCGIHIVGRAHRLRINYRTTAEIQRFAMSVLEGLDIEDLDGGSDTLNGYRSLISGAAPEVKVHSGFNEELDTILAFLGDEDARQRSTCLVTRTHSQLDRYHKALDERGVPVYPLSRRRAEDLSKPGVRLATMHRVKGLEFERVILAGVNDGEVPLRFALEDTEDATVRESREVQERALFYVACSRARQEVLVTTSGEPSVFIR